MPVSTVEGRCSQLGALAYRAHVVLLCLLGVGLFRGPRSRGETGESILGTLTGPSSRSGFRDWTKGGWRLCCLNSVFTRSVRFTGSGGEENGVTWVSQQQFLLGWLLSRSLPEGAEHQDWGATLPTITGPRAVMKITLTYTTCRCLQTPHMNIPTRMCEYLHANSIWTHVHSDKETHIPICNTQT